MASKRFRSAQRGQRLQYFLMLLPALALLLVFDIYPKLGAIYLSFFEWPGVGPKTFVGLRNYTYILTNDYLSETFWNAFYNNVRFFVIVLGCYVVFGTLFALALSLKVKGANAYRLVYYLPHPLATVAVAFLWGLMLNPQYGPLNVVLRAVGLGEYASPWLGDAGTALPVLALVNCWHLIGFPILLLMAAMASVRTDLLEAAVLDGATRWQVIRKIILPLMRPTYVLLSVLVFAGSFNTFDLIFVLQGQEGGPNYATDVLGTLFYRTAFPVTGSGASGFGLAAAIAVLTALIILPAAIWISLRNLRASRI